LEAKTGNFHQKILCFQKKACPRQNRQRNLPEKRMTARPNPEIPIILMTGFGKDIDNASSVNKLGICKMLKKPVRLADLVSMINEILTRTG